MQVVAAAAVWNLCVLADVRGELIKVRYILLQGDVFRCNWWGVYMMGACAVQLLADVVSQAI